MEREKLKIELIKYENWVEEQGLKEYFKTTTEKTIDNYLSTLPDEKEAQSRKKQMQYEIDIIKNDTFITSETRKNEIQKIIEKYSP